MRVLALAATLVLAGCGSAAAPPTARHHPSVMSLNPCIDAILHDVADPAQIASISAYSQDPAATSVPLAWARRFPVNAGTAEEVIARRPDVVLIGPHTAGPTLAALRHAGVRAVEIGVPATIADSRAQVRAVAAAVGHPAAGEALVARIDRALAAATPAPGQPRIEALIRERGALVPGPGTLADELLRRTGFTNAAGRYHLAAWDILPAEPLIAAPPAVILTDPRLIDTDHGTIARHIAARSRLVAFPDRLLMCAGPNLIEAAARLGAARRALAGV